MIASVGAVVGIGLVETLPAVFVPMAAAGCLGLLFLGSPGWIVPVFIAVTWASLPGSAFGGMPSPVEAGGLLLAGFALWRATLRPRLAATVALLLALLGLPLLIAALLSPVGMTLPSDDLRELLFLPIAALCVYGARGPERTVTALVVAGVILGIGGIFSILVGPTALFPLATDQEFIADQEAPRAAGPFGEPNFYALSLAALTPLALFLIQRGGWQRWVGIGALPAIAGGILAAGSRGAMLAMILALVASAISTPSRSLRLAVAATVVLGVLSVPIFASQADSSATRSVGGRATENRVALAMLEDRPLTGFGPNTYSFLYRDRSRYIGNDTRSAREAHSLPLEIGAEQGLVGIVGWLLAGAVALTYALRRGVRETPLGRALLLAPATYLFGSLFLHGSQLRIPFMLIGLLLAYATEREVAGKSSPRLMEKVP